MKSYSEKILQYGLKFHQYRLVRATIIKFYKNLNLSSLPLHMHKE